MADEIIPAGGQTPPAANITPGQTPPTSGQTPATPQSSGGDEVMTVAEARALREELKQRRLTEEAAVKERDQLKKSLMTEAERKEAELAELKAKVPAFEQKEQEWRVERAILIAAPDVGIKPALAMKLLDWSAVKTDKAGEPTNIPELLAQIFVDYPELKPQTSQQPAATPRPNVGATNPPRSQVNLSPQESVKDLARYTLADAYRKTNQQQ